MPSLTDSDRLFVEQRRSRKHVGLYVLPALLVLLGVLWAALFAYWPLAVNPKAISGAVELQTITCGQGSLTWYAQTATVLVNVLLFVLAVVVLVGIARAGRERRYLRMIDRLTKEQALAPPRVPAEASTVRQ